MFTSDFCTLWRLGVGRSPHDSVMADGSRWSTSVSCRRNSLTPPTNIAMHHFTIFVVKLRSNVGCVFSMKIRIVLTGLQIFNLSELSNRVRFRYIIPYPHKCFYENKPKLFMFVE